MIALLFLLFVIYPDITADTIDTFKSIAGAVMVDCRDVVATVTDEHILPSCAYPPAAMSGFVRSSSKIVPLVDCTILTILDLDGIALVIGMKDARLYDE